MKTTNLNWHLHSCKEWEDARPENAIYEEMFFSRRKITKIIGYVKLSDGHKLPCHWDGFGVCYIEGNKVYNKGRAGFI